MRHHRILCRLVFASLILSPLSVSMFAEPVPRQKEILPVTVPLEIAPPLPPQIQSTLAMPELPIQTSQEASVVPSVPASSLIQPKKVDEPVKVPPAIPGKKDTQRDAFDSALLEKPIELPPFPATGVFNSKGPFVVISQNQKLSDFIDMIAVKKGINIVFADALPNTLNFPERLKVPLSVAEDYLYTFLAMSGYVMQEREGFFIISKHTENSVTRAPLPLYVNVPPENFPQTDEEVRAIFYFANLKVPESIEPGGSPLNVVLREMVSPQAGSYFYDPKSNGLVIVGRARRIAAAMQVLLRLDSAGTSEKLARIQLFNASAAVVAKIFNEQIIWTTQGLGRFRPSVKSFEDLYFAPNTRVLEDPVSNSVIVLGQEMTINRIKELIREYIDVPPESGKSVIHVYDLQYLNAKDFEGVLKQIVRQPSGATEQSLREGGGGGPQRWFDNPIVMSERVEVAQAKTAGAAGGALPGVTIGGNRLIVAATNSDWEWMKRSIIEPLDKPELQVICEVVVVDLDFASKKGISTQLRNPAGLDLPYGMSFQSAQLYSQIVNVPSGTTDTTMATDLLRLLSGGKSLAAITTANSTNFGSMIISFNDPQTNTIWSVLKILEQYSERKVLAHPILVAKNNMQAREYSKEIRERTGGVASSQTVVTNVKIVPYEAVFEVKITPRISSIDRVNLSVFVKIDDFLDSEVVAKTNRSIETNATLNSGQILVIGGLTRSQVNETEYAIPFLSKIPIIGWLFKGKTRTLARSNLAVFIQPTVVDPKLRLGINRFTNDRIKYVKGKTTELFSGVMDPVSNFFFGNEREALEMVNNYVERSRHKAPPDTEETVPSSAVIDEQESRRLKDLLRSEKNPITGLD